LNHVAAGDLAPHDTSWKGPASEAHERFSKLPLQGFRKKLIFSMVKLVLLQMPQL
jgi:hypothetical protein